MSLDVRYAHEALAWEYDQRNGTIAPGELAWYKKYAQVTGGPMLELACGSGYFLFMVAQVELGQFAGGGEVVVDWLEQPISDDVTGLAVGSRFASRLDPGGDCIATERTYRIERRGVDAEVIHDVTLAPIVRLAEYNAMLEGSGFVSHVYSGYDEQPVTETGRTLCFVCQKSPPRLDRQ